VAQLSQSELEQIQSYLAQQGVTFNATSTDAAKREVIYAAINQITRNPAQVFGYKLDDYNFSRVAYHLAYNIATVPAGDYARLVEACNSIPSEFYNDKIVQQIERCEEAERFTELADGRATSRQETILGDVSRSINIQDKRETARIWRENYMYECDRLAQQLYVPNYRDPVAARYRFERSGGEFIQAIPGPPDVSRSDRLYFQANWR
jgi:LPS sulfotransferase NodH